MNTSNFSKTSKIILDIGHLCLVFRNILQERLNIPDAQEKIQQLELEDYTYRVLEALLIPLINKDVAGKFNNQLNQAILDSLIFDLSSQQVTYQNAFEIICGLESYALRLLVDTLPDIDSEDFFVESVARLNKTTVVIDVLKCSSLLISSRYV